MYMYVIVILLVAIFAYSLFKEAIDKKVKGFSLSNIQRKFAIVGLTAFIVWLLMAISNSAFLDLSIFLQGKPFISIPRIVIHVSILQTG